MDQQTLKVTKSGSSVPQVQFCFVLDATGSMDKYIKIVQRSLLGVFKTFEELQLTNFVQIGFVFYRDFSEENQEYITQMKDCKPAGWKPQKKIEFIDFQLFTEEGAKQGGEIYELLEDISKRCDGGDDYAEDIAGGFRKMLELNWLVASDRTTKIAVLITDAPCHGKEFHEGVLDDFSDLTKKPEADIRPLIDQMIQKNINLSIIEIDTRTNKMVKVVQDYYAKKDSLYKLQTLFLVEDLKGMMSQQAVLSEAQITILAQILLERLQLSYRRFRI